MLWLKLNTPGFGVVSRFSVNIFAYKMISGLMPLCASFWQMSYHFKLTISHLRIWKLLDSGLIKFDGNWRVCNRTNDAFGFFPTDFDVLRKSEGPRGCRLHRDVLWRIRDRTANFEEAASCEVALMSEAGDENVGDGGRALRGIEI